VRVKLPALDRGIDIEIDIDIDIDDHGALADTGKPSAAARKREPGDRRARPERCAVGMHGDRTGSDLAA